MADIAWNPDVIAVAPELSTAAVAAQIAILAHVNTDLDVSMFDGEGGPMTRLARMYLAAHFGTQIGAGASAGAVVSESAGGLSRSYASVASSESSLGSTAYGRLYLSLANVSFARLPVLL